MLAALNKFFRATLSATVTLALRVSFHAILKSFNKKHVSSMDHHPKLGYLTVISDLALSRCQTHCFDADFFVFIQILHSRCLQLEFGRSRE